MAMDTIQLISAIAGSSVVSTALTLLVQGGRDARRQEREQLTMTSTAEVEREKNRDNLTFELIETARVEIHQLRTELARLRPLEGHLVHFDEALLHMERLLGAAHMGEDERQQVERDARAFVNRMRRVREAAGVMRNEVQRIDSAVEVAARNIEKGERK